VGPVAEPVRAYESQWWKRLKDLEIENTHLKKLSAEAELD
jgi:hypothetical protein